MSLCLYSCSISLKYMLLNSVMIPLPLMDASLFLSSPNLWVLATRDLILRVVLLSDGHHASYKTQTIIAAHYPGSTQTISNARIWKTLLAGEHRTSGILATMTDTLARDSTLICPTCLRFGVPCLHLTLNRRAPLLSITPKQVDCPFPAALQVVCRRPLVFSTVHRHIHGVKELVLAYALERPYVWLDSGLRGYQHSLNCLRMAYCSTENDRRDLLSQLS
jgi:hypothetical protein